MKYFSAAFFVSLMSLPCSAESDWLMKLDLDSPIESKNYVTQQPADSNPNALRSLDLVNPRPMRSKDAKENSILPGFEFELREKVKQLLLRPESKPARKRPAKRPNRATRNEEWL